MGDTVYGNKSGDTVYGNKYVHDGVLGRRDTILLLSADPDGHGRLQLDEERRAIDREVAYSRAARRLEVRTADALRIDDLQQALLRHRPIVAHFSGHGHPREGIQVVDQRGRPRAVPPSALSGLFGILKTGLRCVVLNACHTSEQAEAIAVHVPCVIGMRRRVLDETAILFATGLYRGFADGQTIQASFKLARNNLDLNGVPELDVPQLVTRPGAADRPLISGLF